MEWLGNDITYWILVALMASAFAAGFIDAVAGGGGLILVPSFILAGLPPQLALGQENLLAGVSEEELTTLKSVQSKMLSNAAKYRNEG